MYIFSIVRILMLMKNWN